jgi:hypothetical protein
MRFYTQNRSKATDAPQSEAECLILAAVGLSTLRRTGGKHWHFERSDSGNTTSERWKAAHKTLTSLDHLGIRWWLWRGRKNGVRGFDEVLTWLEVGLGQ